MMPDPSDGFEAAKFESTLLTLFIPSVDRQMMPIDQARWQQEALELLGTYFDGATAFPKGRGVWRDDQQGGKLIFDEPVVIHCYTNFEALDAIGTHLRIFSLEWERKRTKAPSVS